MRLSGRRNPRTNLQGNAGGVIGGRGAGGGGGVAGEWMGKLGCVHVCARAKRSVARFIALWPYACNIDTKNRKEQQQKCIKK